MSRRYRITHHTTYSYDENVTDSYGMVLARPRDLALQQVLEHELRTEPGPGDIRSHEDAAGNHAAYFQVTEPHRRLVVSAVSLVECQAQHGLPRCGSWERSVPASRPDLPEAALAAEYTAPSKMIDVDDAVAEYAAVSFPPGRSMVEAVIELVGRVNTDFEYDPGATDVSTLVPDVLAARKGVCQDFAHLTIACLRSLGLAARYVSGYLATEPPPGKPRMVGVDATHAWLQCWVPDPRGGSAWLSVDPTNNLVTSDRHITVAWGRDYADVPPVKGVIFTQATESSMTVTVDVEPVTPGSTPGPPPGPPPAPASAP